MYLENKGKKLEKHEGCGIFDGKDSYIEREE
jgi:hypothetical protein